MLKQILAFLLSILSSILVFFHLKQPPEPVTSKLVVICSAVEYKPHEELVCSFDGRIVADGRAMFMDQATLLREAFDELEAIPYADDFQIFPEGKYATAETTFYYVIYDETLESVSSGPGLSGITIPNGISLLHITANWRKGEHYSTFTYDFKISRAMPSSDPAEKDTITVFSNGATHEPHMNLMYSMFLHEGHTYIADGKAMFFDKATLRREAFDLLNEIPYADDFQIILEGKYATAETTFYYEIYDDSLTLLSSGKGLGKLSFPTGVSLLYIEAYWRKSDSERSIYTYDFKISK